MRANPFQILSEDAAGRLQVKRCVLFLAAASMMLNVMLSLHLLLSSDEQRTIVLAPGPSVQYIAADDEVSPNLLERFAMTSLGLITNMTPQTSAWAIGQFMEHVAPEAHHEILSLLSKGAEELKRSDAAIAFFPSSSQVDSEKQQVCLRGERRVLLAGAKTSSTKQTLCLTATVRMGRIWIVGLTNKNDTL